MGIKLEQEVQGIVQDILTDYGKNREIDKMQDFFCQPDKAVSYTHLDVYKRQAFVPSAAGLIIASEVVKDLIRPETELS